MIYRDIVLEIAKQYPKYSVAEIREMITFQFVEIRNEIRDNPGATCFMGNLGEIGPPKSLKKSSVFHDWLNTYKKRTNQENDRTPLYYNDRERTAKIKNLSLDLEEKRTKDNNS